MKFNCDDDRHKPLSPKKLQTLEDLRNKGNLWRAAHAHLAVWHKWFAWYPVHLGNGDCRWLEYVERRKEFNDGIYIATMMTHRVYYRPHERPDL
jgi:hypothetical protein